MEPNVLLQAVGTVGFPIVVAGFVLIRNDKKIEKMTEAINELSKAIVTCPLKEVNVNE